MCPFSRRHMFSSDLSWELCCYLFEINSFSVFVLDGLFGWFVSSSKSTRATSFPFLHLVPVFCIAFMMVVSLTSYLLKASKLHSSIVNGCLGESFKVRLLKLSTLLNYYSLPSFFNSIAKIGMSRGVFLALFGSLVHSKIHLSEECDSPLPLVLLKRTIWSKRNETSKEVLLLPLSGRHWLMTILKCALALKNFMMPLLIEFTSFFNSNLLLSNTYW